METVNRLAIITCFSKPMSTFLFYFNIETYSRGRVGSLGINILENIYVYYKGA